MAVVIKKSGFYAKDWNSKIRRDVEKRIKDPMLVIGRMNDVVELEDNVTLGHLVDLFRGDYNFIKEFVAMLVDCNLADFWAPLQNQWVKAVGIRPDQAVPLFAGRRSLSA